MLLKKIQNPLLYIIQTMKSISLSNGPRCLFYRWVYQSMEKEMAAHSSIPAWEIPWTEEPGRPRSMGSQRTGHDFSSVQSLSRVQLFVTPWTTAHQPSLSITNSQSPPKLMSIKSVMPSNHLILCHSLLLLPSIFLSIRVFSNESALRIRWPKFFS